jgi:esterase/lipase
MSNVHINVAQMAGTAASISLVGSAVGGVFARLSKRRTQAALSAAAAATKTAALEAALSTQQAISEATSAITTSVTARIDESDKDTARKIEGLDDRARRTEEKLIRVEAQFGPNGGGLRQRFDEVAKAVSRVEGRLDQHVADTSR